MQTNDKWIQHYLRLLLWSWLLQHTPAQHRSLQLTAGFASRPFRDEPLSWCQGDCNSDDDCLPGFMCFQRSRGDDAPGCVLSSFMRNTSMDFCMPTAALDRPLFPEQEALLARIVDCKNKSGIVLGICQGDCDRDDDCAEGLRCWHRTFRDASSSVCQLTEYLQSTNFDFCVPIVEEEEEESSVGTESLFALKLYWDEGYHRLDETEDQKWCMSCFQGCHVGHKVALEECKDDFPHVTQWFFPSYHPGQVQIASAGNRDLCLQQSDVDEASRIISVSLQACNETNGLQQFILLGNEESSRFEIVSSQSPDYCLTQEHDPKHDEVVYLKTCDEARWSNTSHWSRYYG